VRSALSGQPRRQLPGEGHDLGGELLLALRCKAGCEGCDAHAADDVAETIANRSREAGRISDSFTGRTRIALLGDDLQSLTQRGRIGYWDAAVGLNRSRDRRFDLVLREKGK